MRIPWISVALLLVVGMLAALTYPGLSKPSGGTVQNFETVYGLIGWVAVAGALIVGALGVWARAPATLATALAILGCGAFGAMWMTQFIENADYTGLYLGMVIAFMGAMVALAASSRPQA